MFLIDFRLNPVRKPTSTHLLDQAPLSASLLNDWLDGSDIAPSDTADLQEELESTSSSLFFDT